MTKASLFFWLSTAFSIGVAFGPFVMIPFMPKDRRRIALDLALHPFRKPSPMFPPPKT